MTSKLLSVKLTLPALLLLSIWTSPSANGQTTSSLKPVASLRDLTGLPIPNKSKTVALPPFTAAFNATPAICRPGSCGALPVELLSFEGHRIDRDNVMLLWKTTHEENNLGFDVERSLGNTGQFIKISFVPALTDNSLIHNYTLQDANSFAGTSYYRLKQVDLDSQFVYSKIIAINNEGQPESITCYPNPAHNTLYAKIVSANSGNARIQLSGAEGRTVSLQSSFLQHGENLIQLDVSGLAAGIYFIRVNTAGGAKMLVGSVLKD